MAKFSPTVSQLQADLLRRHGFVRRDLATIADEKLEYNPPSVITNSLVFHKSVAMRLVESRFGKPLEELLALEMKGGDVARKLDVAAGTISKWRKQLGIKPTRGRPKNG